MKIAETYSHLNGLEFLLVHKPALCQETQTVIAKVGANQCRTKVSRERTMKGKLLYSPMVGPTAPHESPIPLGALLGTEQ
jgi:hypothetical protein